MSMVVVPRKRSSLNDPNASISSTTASVSTFSFSYQQQPPCQEDPCPLKVESGGNSSGNSSVMSVVSMSSTSSSTPFSVSLYQAHGWIAHLPQSRRCQSTSSITSTRKSMALNPLLLDDVQPEKSKIMTQHRHQHVDPTPSHHHEHHHQNRDSKSSWSKHRRSHSHSNIQGNVQCHNSNNNNNNDDERNGCIVSMQDDEQRTELSREEMERQMIEEFLLESQQLDQEQRTIFGQVAFEQAIPPEQKGQVPSVVTVPCTSGSQEVILAVAMDATDAYDAADTFNNEVHSFASLSLYAGEAMEGKHDDEDDSSLYMRSSPQGTVISPSSATSIITPSVTDQYPALPWHHQQQFLDSGTFQYMNDDETLRNSEGWPSMNSPMDDDSRSSVVLIQHHDPQWGITMTTLEGEVPTDSMNGIDPQRQSLSLTRPIIMQLRTKSMPVTRQESDMDATQPEEIPRIGMSPSTTRVGVLMKPQRLITKAVSSPATLGIVKSVEDPFDSHPLSTSSRPRSHTVSSSTSSSPMSQRQRPMGAVVIWSNLRKRLLPRRKEESKNSSKGRF